LTDSYIGKLIQQKRNTFFMPQNRTLASFNQIIRSKQISGNVPAVVGTFYPNIAKAGGKKKEKKA
jgi:hypothetical protein